MDAWVPLFTGTGGPITIVQVKQATTHKATFDSPPTPGNKIFCLVNGQQGITSGTLNLDLGGLTIIGSFRAAGADGSSGVMCLGYRDVVAGDPAGPYGDNAVGSNNQTTLIELSGLPAGGPLNTTGIGQQTGTSITRSITPAGGVDAWLIGAFGSKLKTAFGGTPTFTPNGSTTTVGVLGYHSGMWGVGQMFYGTSSGGAVTLGGTQGGTVQDGSYVFGIQLGAFAVAGGSLSWPAAPETVDESDATSVDVDEESIFQAGGVIWRADLGSAVTLGELRAVLGMTDAGTTALVLQGGDLGDWSDAATVIELDFEATGGLAADELELAWDGTDTYRYWQLVLAQTEQDLRIFEIGLTEAEIVTPTPPGRAILEIYVHDEDASRWGEATWATGPATGTEGIWSAAGWQDVTPQGVNAHVIWGSRRPEAGILAEQNAASWNVETYDPERILDPGNLDSPYAPQLVAGVPIRISHDSHVIRTGYIDRIAYNHKAPDYRGQLLATDTLALLNQAFVPADSVLGNTVLERIQDAINAAGVAVGGIPLPPGGPSGPAIADWEEGAASDAPTSVLRHVQIATQEALWVAFVQADAGLGLRPWGEPIDRGREITAPNLEDLEAYSSEEGLYSVVRVQVENPALDPIEREAGPLPRYGRRVLERTEPTVDPEGWAYAVLAERAWPAVQYRPGTIHCFTAADVDYFGGLEIMERVSIIVPGVVAVTGRVLGGELFVEHRKDSTHGATWQFLFNVATDGAAAIGLTTLVADGTGEVLLDDPSGLDYLEED